MDIKKQRELAGITQSDLATKLSVTIATISRWENGHAKPHRSFLKQMEKIFKGAK
jgi:putative transcriptional regulator